MTQDAMDDIRPRMPRAVSLVVIGAIVVAAVAALVWPNLPHQLFSGPTEVGVIRGLVPAPNAAPRIGGIAPDFEWNAPDGKTKKLFDLRGKTVVIDFWATWCQPCREEMPAMERVAAQGTGDTVFLAVDLMEDGARVRTFMDSLSLSHLTPLLDLDGAVTRAYSVLELPQTFFIDRQGVIQHIEHGQVMDDDTVRRGIAKAR